MLYLYRTTVVVLAIPELDLGVPGQPSDRRTSIVDAAIHLLAQPPSRGLTHRAVDRFLELPAGSTANYFSTRASLLHACGERIVALDLREVAALPDFRPQMTTEQAGRLAAAWLTAWATGAARDRQRARYALLLEATHPSPLIDLLTRFREGFTDMVADKLRAIECSEPERRAAAFIASFDGLLIDQILYPHSGLDSEQIAEHLTDLLRHTTGNH
ncbi:TetR family transcriptional regulator [Gordonia sp. TBRC 11910]|uniref:TetR family transcriptional regulator n=1 Tax=Gordonia asplenii TaxID=2725283 RepID=A0A848L732_9ACTN|nr:TetR family transcriptional regulator [Gordonia asplenii]NMO04503.1 TetR family transcriptional regulator [Gordonia asplenii]